MREWKALEIFKDKNGDIIEEGDVLEIDLNSDDTINYANKEEYAISRVHWDWRRNGLGILPMKSTDKFPRSEFIEAVASSGSFIKHCAKIIVKHDSDGALANRIFDPEIFSSGGMPVPTMTREQAEKIGDYNDYYSDCTGKFWNEKVYLKKMYALKDKINFREKWRLKNPTMAYIQDFLEQNI